MALLLRTLESVQRSPSTLSFAQYREAESQNYKQSSVTSDGELLDVLTLELRVHPPNVRPLARRRGARRGGRAAAGCAAPPPLPPAVRARLLLAARAARAAPAAHAPARRPAPPPPGRH
jgi:hypothetical protein